MSVSVAVPARVRSSAALVLAGVLWGTGGLAGSLLASRAGLHPLSVAAYRLLVGGVTATLYVGLTGGFRGLRGTPGVLRRVVAVGLLLALFQTSYFAAVALSSVSVATMTTIGAAPVFVAAVSAVRRRRLPRGWTVLSLAGSLAGLVLLRWSPVTDAAGLLGGLGFSLLAAAGFAALTLVMARPVEGLDPLSANAFGCLLGGLALTPAALWLGMGLPVAADVLALAAYFGVVPTALAYAAYFRGLTHAHPLLGALSALLEPLTASLLAAVILHEHLSGPAWAGAALLVAALLVAALLVAALAVTYWRPEN
ncbi:DMT family transporter [Amycolatopsis sp. H20-H5]|uniref:DMT family transporter n=1 Tax=Amycolatopsis sp. H20-H5 TaxID=3046309 RepID=UPI002DBF942E|nr:EamA family transporter [Amycolatopsis sp. H20-H5]MEC3974036.1 EamA family transporter [Amycolatopsis sp. H20-H5]